MSERLNCCIPFCRRTTRNDEGYSEWVCGKHWQAVPKTMRRIYIRARRVVDRRYRWDYWAEPAGSEARIGGHRAVQRTLRLWRRCKRAAIERAGGLA